ncbi:MAG: hypothetical protein CSA20_06130 [Deltaproteobacteria bacterium]|nr:MAG: hypothetical protein CSA20_06130 [Deltaproteobacteria bacterium]
MPEKISKVFFDKNDFLLLQIVNDVLERGVQSQALHSLLEEYMHPHGIKEMAAPMGLRVAYAIASLLGTFEKGEATERIRALHSLRDEVFLSSQSYFQKNTARVLLQIMKELVRCRQNPLTQLKLAHDFRIAITGKPQVIRNELKKYHLLEMPEEWNQVAFDDHVHDANTKGRKSPTHLVMDAWIKGIRYLTVVYYNYVRPDVIRELIEASAVLDVRVQIGIEISSRFRNKFARFTWEPYGFNDNEAFLQFLEEKPVIELMQEGFAVSQYQQKYVFDVLEEVNTRHRKTIEKEFGLAIPPIQRQEFIEFVGTGQPSVLHLAGFIRNAMMHSASTIDLGQQKRQDLQKKLPRVDKIIEDFLLPEHNPMVHNPTVPSDSEETPALQNCPLNETLKRLLSLHPNSKFTLNLGNLTAQDTLELLYESEGMITHVEAYNLKNATHGISGTTELVSESIPKEVGTIILKNRQRLINDLQKALCEDNVIVLKRVIREIIWDYEDQRHQLSNQLKTNGDTPNRGVMERLIQQMQERKLDLIEILFNLETFYKYYKKKSLKSRIGSGSTGRAEHHYGMGLVVLETLPARARKFIRAGSAKEQRTIVPVTALLLQNIHRRKHLQGGNPTYGSSQFNAMERRENNGRSQQWKDWSLEGFLVHEDREGNVATLGGLRRHSDTSLDCWRRDTSIRLSEWWKYLNTTVKNTIKVFVGFVPAFLTFYLTKDWWVLAYFGALIWFGITGTRNIIQAVLGGGGLRRSQFQPWNSFVSWSRISDSLLYTGFSVPLLDYLVKTLILDQGLHITTTTNPVALYSVMGLANGIYISSHNVFRGLPRGAAVGNLFRSILAIPVAVLLNALLVVLLGLFGVPDVTGALQKWAAIISKFASDCVAAFIEGIADRQKNIRVRLTAYKMKISQLFGVFSRFELLFPEEDVLEMLSNPKNMMRTINKEAAELEKVTIVNALDFMYFWMYQPRARKALSLIVSEMTREEWLIFYRSQTILKRHKEISQVFVDGLVGKSFSRALAFYLDQSEQYLLDLQKMADTRKNMQ